MWLAGRMFENLTLDVKSPLRKSYILLPREFTKVWREAHSCQTSFPIEISQRPHLKPYSQQDRKCTHKNYIKARSRNRCCHGKVIRITFWVCICSLSYPVRRAHAPYYIVVCGRQALVCCFFFTVFEQRHDFRKKEKTLEKKRTFYFLYDFVRNISHSENKSPRYDRQYTHVHVKCPLYRVTQKKTGTFEKPNKNWRNPRKKNYWQKLNHYNLPFKRQ